MCPLPLAKMLVVPISFFSGRQIMLWRVEGDFTAGKLTPTDFDFLHSGLTLSSMSRVCLPLLTGVLARDVIAALVKW